MKLAIRPDYETYSQPIDKEKGECIVFCAICQKKVVKRPWFENYETQRKYVCHKCFNDAPENKKKECLRCHEKKSLKEFSSHAGMSDGHINFCKECKRVESKIKRMNEKKTELESAFLKHENLKLTKLPKIEIKKISENKILFKMEVEIEI